MSDTKQHDSQPFQIGYFIELIGKVQIFRERLASLGYNDEIAEVRVSPENWRKLGSDINVKSWAVVANWDVLDRVKIGGMWVIMDPKVKTELICMELSLR